MYLASGDSFDLFNAAFHVEQTFEKTLRVVLQRYGIDPDADTKCADLIKLIPKGTSEISPSTLCWMQGIAPTLDEWNKNSMYIDDCAINIREVRNAYNLVKEWIYFVSCRRYI